MAKSKEVFYKLSAPVVSLTPFSLLRKISGFHSLIPLYHSVAATAPPHLKYLYSIKTPEQFSKDLEFLLRHYKPVDLQELVKLTTEGSLHKKPVFHLTFDDGLSEFYHTAAPVLFEKGIPATCFINPDFTDNKDMLFRLKASILIDHLHQAKAGSASWIRFHEWVQEYHLGCTYYRKLLLDIKHNDREKIQRLAALLGISFEHYLKKHKPYMSSKQISELAEKGFSIGAHSMDHPEYHDIEEAQQLEQTKQSVEHVRKHFKSDINTFSFPFTDHRVGKSFFNELSGWLDLSFGCAGIKRDEIPNNLQRLSAEYAKYTFSGLLKRELLYYTFLKIAGKHIILRS